MAKRSERDDDLSRRTAAADPIIVLSYMYSQARCVQDALAADSELACTFGTGIVPLCQMAAETWQRVEAQHGQALSRLAVSTVRALVTAQVTAVLADGGKTRWCELTIAPPKAAEAFLQVFPHAAFVCVHRGCLDMIRAGVQASPWGLHGQGLTPYLLSYAGNSVAALATYWMNSTEELLAFEKAHSEITHRVRYEDVADDPDEALAKVRTWLGLDNPRPSTLTEHFGSPESGAQALPSEAEVPVMMIPAALRERISRLHAELGHPPLGG